MIFLEKTSPQIPTSVPIDVTVVTQSSYFHMYTSLPRRHSFGSSFNLSSSCWGGMRDEPKECLRGGLHVHRSSKESVSCFSLIQSHIGHFLLRLKCHFWRTASDGSTCSSLNAAFFPIVSKYMQLKLNHVCK